MPGEIICHGKKKYSTWFWNIRDMRDYLVKYVRWSAAITPHWRAKWYLIPEVCTSQKVFIASSHCTAKSSSVPTKDMPKTEEDHGYIYIKRYCINVFSESFEGIEAFIV